MRAPRMQPGGRRRKPPGELVTLALQHMQAGERDKAAKALRMVLSDLPQHADANHLLGVIFLQSGKPEQALGLINKALASDPRLVFAHNNLGEVYRQLSRPEKAAECYRRAIEIDPRMVAAHANLAATLVQLGENDEAEACFRKTLALDPRDAQAHLGLANFLLEQGRVDAAFEQFAIAIKANDHDPQLHNALGVALQGRGRIDDALKAFHTALQRDPGFVRAWNNIGLAHEKAGRLNEAIAAHQKALDAAPHDLQGHHYLASALSDAGRVEDAISTYEMALRKAPRDGETLCLLGDCYISMGRSEEGIEKYRRALSLGWRPGETWHALAVAKKFSPGDADLSRMERALAQLTKRNEPASGDQQTMYLSFALAKAHEDARDFEASFRNLIAGNRLQRDTLPYDHEAEREKFAQIKTAFSAARFRDRVGHDDRTPVFILGMPRSGTTLVEQILSSHSQVHGAGELTQFGQLVRGLAPDGGKPYPECVASLEAADFNGLGRDYVDVLRGLASGAGRVTDKLPHNFLHIGAIAMALPQATVIRCVRSPLDNCLSLFKQRFRSGHGYSNDLGDLGRYYLLYDDLMKHWHSVLPGFVHEVVYEDLVADQETQTRRLLEICGLPWEDACLAFHRNERLVTTMSVAQVRRPMNADSVALWKKYGERLQPLIDALQPVL